MKSQPGGGELTATQKRAFATFEYCIEQAWGKVTAAPYDPDLATTLAGLIRILPFDPAGPERDAVCTTIAGALARPKGAVAALATIETMCGKLMADRGGIDLHTIRQELMAHELALLPIPDFRQDIVHLQEHSRAIADSLERYEVIEAVPGDHVTVKRECHSAILEAAASGSLLIVGEPGAGKSGVLNALARDLRERGSDILELAVDRYSVETLEGLSRELGLEHGLVETLEAWDGPEPGWIVVDALDATRGGKGEGVFRTLIERVMERDGRWRVIASIRTFDLRMGQQLRTLFKGTPPVAAFQESGFMNVRHVRVPPWSETEFAQLLSRAPALRAALDNAPPVLRDLALVPFNTRLLCELIKDGLVTTDFSHVASQAELLRLYWEHRVEAEGAPAGVCILRIVETMVNGRALRVQFAIAAGNEPATLDALESEGVLVSTNHRRWVQFRHHLIFDFAAARMLLDPGELIKGSRRFPKNDAHGLMLAPALGFTLREIWDRDRSDFWSAATLLLADEQGDPVIRSSVARICAEYPREPEDLASLAQRIVAGDVKAAQAFNHLSGALAIRLEDQPDTPLGAWVGLVGSLAPNVAPVADTVRFLLYTLIDRVTDEKGRVDIGIAARALFEYSLALENPRNLVVPTIDFVAETYATDPTASRGLLERIFAAERLEAYAPEEVPALCRKIEAIAVADPEFAARIYQATYGFSVTDSRETKLGESQILSLRSNARQDYEMARYELGEHITTFLTHSPKHAVFAIVSAVDAFVAREHPLNKQMLDTELVLGEHRVHLQEDQSCIWAYSPEEDRLRDADLLIKKLLDFLRSIELGIALEVAKTLIYTASLAIFWSRLFLVAAERDDELLDLVLPIVLQEAFLTLPDTRKDAVDVVVSGYDRLGEAERVAFEAKVEGFDFQRFQRPDDARADFEQLLFGAIGRERLAGEYARAVAAEDADTNDVENVRPSMIRTGPSLAQPYHWTENLDQEAPANQRAIETNKQTLQLETDNTDNGAVPLTTSLDAMEALAVEIDRSPQRPQLIVYAEGQIARGLERIVAAKLVPATEASEATARLLALIRLVAASLGPSLHDDTEAEFERSAAWAPPAPRVDAVEIVLDLMLQRPDLYSVLELDLNSLLEDRHPAVRRQAALHLVRIWDLDREGFWQRLDARLTVEPNLSVIDDVVASVISWVLHADASRTEPLVLKLLERFRGEPERQDRVRDMLASPLADLWVTYQNERAFKVLSSWIERAVNHVPELCKILTTLRDAFVAGLNGDMDADDEGRRHRSQALAHSIVQTANAGLTTYFALVQHSETQIEEARGYTQLIDTVCRELHFSAGVGRNRGNVELVMDRQDLEQFFTEVAPTLEAIGDYATPRTVHYLLQLLEYLLPFDPVRAFHLTAHVLRRGGQHSGYQYESLGADLFVQLIGVFLADYKRLFDDDARRSALIDCLEIFMDAGWPGARRLLYRLPELVQ